MLSAMTPMRINRLRDLNNINLDLLNGLMKRCRQLFLIGNKRSGTSLMVRLLNSHPRIFVTKESDVIWLLYQARENWPERFTCYRWDGPLGLRATLEACKQMLDAERHQAIGNPAELYRRMQLHRMKGGSRLHRWLGKRRLKWLGDKKPVQQCDPDIRLYLREIFPQARYLHIVRHPGAVVASMVSAAQNWAEGVPDYWYQGREKIIQRWGIHEQWAIDARETDGLNVHTLKFEDLVCRPIDEMRKVFDFLELDSREADLSDQLAQIDPDPNRKYANSESFTTPAIREIMLRYGYTIDAV